MLALVDLVLVLDRSGSVGPQEDEIKRFADQVLSQFELDEASTLFGLVTFADEAMIGTDLTDDRDQVTDAIAAYNANGQTCISCGIDTARGVLKDSPKSRTNAGTANYNERVRKIIFLVTDGDQTEGCRDIGCRKTAIDMAKEARDDGIELYATGFRRQRQQRWTIVRHARQDGRGPDDAQVPGHRRCRPRGALRQPLHRAHLAVGAAAAARAAAAGLAAAVAAAAVAVAASAVAAAAVVAARRAGGHATVAAAAAAAVTARRRRRRRRRRARP